MTALRCVKCGCVGAFLRLQETDAGIMCEACLSDLARMGWTIADYKCAKTNRETVQVHNAHKAEGR